MEVRFVKDWFNPSTNRWISAGRIVHIMRKKALELIAEGYCIEILPFGFVEESNEPVELKEEIPLPKIKKRKKLF